MSRRLHWMLFHTRTWHAWPHAGRATMCGKLNVETLRERPARRIVDELTPEDWASACKRCLAESGVEVPVSGEAGLNNVARLWVGCIERHLLRAQKRVAQKARLPQADINTLAWRLSEIGNPTEREAQEIFEQIKSLLLLPFPNKYPNALNTSMRMPNLHAAVQELPAETQALRKVADAVRCWRKLTGRQPVVSSFKLVQVIQTILRVPAPEAYINRLYQKGLVTLGVMFHPNTLAQAKKDTALRGVFAGSLEYWNKTSAQLEVVTE